MSRWFVTVGGMVLLAAGAFAGGRAIDAVSTSCGEITVRRFLRVDTPTNVENMGPSNVRDAARQASDALGFEVREPCPAPAESFVLNSAGANAYENLPLNRRPYASWSFVLAGEIRPDGVAYVERGITVHQYASAVPAPEDADAVTLGVGEERAYRTHDISIEPEGSDLRSGEVLRLYVYANGGTILVQAVSSPGELPSEAKMLAMLKQMIR